MSSPQAPGRPDSLRPVIGAVVLLFFALLAVAGLKGYRDLTAARARERQLLTRIDETRNGIDQLRGRIGRLRSDPATLERLARDELGMVRPRDVVIELPAGKSGDEESAPLPHPAGTAPPRPPAGISLLPSPAAQAPPFSATPPRTISATPPRTLSAPPPRTISATPPLTLSATAPRNISATPPRTLSATAPRTTSASPPRTIQASPPHTIPASPPPHLR